MTAATALDPCRVLAALGALLVGCGAPGEGRSSLAAPEHALTAPGAPADTAPGPEVHVVTDGSGDFETIQAAIDAAVAGTRVLVDSGSWDESIRIDRPLILSAREGRPVITGAGPGPTLVVGSPGVVLERVVLRAPPSGEPAVVVESGSVELVRCALPSEDAPALVAAGDVRVRLLQSAVTTFDAVGVHVLDGAHVEVVDSEIVRCATGLLVEDASAHLDAARIARCPQGLVLVGDTEATLDGGTIWTCEEVGLDVREGARLQAHGLTVKAPGGAPGLRLAGSVATLSGCTFFGIPAEVDHHAGPTTREHVATPIRSGTDHHILGGMITVEDGAEIEMTSCHLEKALGHGLTMRASRGRLQDVTITSSVFYNLFLENDADPLFVRCTIREAGENGLFAWEGARGTFEDCRFVGNGVYTEDENSWAQAVLTDGAETVFRDTVFLDGPSSGLVVSGGLTRGRFERCEVRGTAGIGLTISAGASPVLIDCTLSGGATHGLWVTRLGGGILVGGTIADNRGHGVHLDHEARAVLRDLTIRANRLNGVTAWRQAASRLEGCDIRDNLGAGVEVAHAGRPTLNRCEVTANQGPGIKVAGDSEIRLLRCDISGNHAGEIIGEDGSRIVKDDA